jgi:hypothetical protein
MWKRIFLLRRNASRDTIFDVGGTVIAVRPKAKYFDLKFPDSVQGWRKKWMYIKDQKTGAQEYGLAPFDPTKEIVRLRSWDAEATPDEVASTEPLLKKIHELQSASKKELSGLQLMTHFLRLRIQPLQARSRPMWAYSGPGDEAKISADMHADDLAKLARRFTKLTKNDPIPSECLVKPYASDHPLPKVLMLFFLFLHETCFFLVCIELINACR